ncbi:24898_t:CDS:2, partial [Gigaspora margarita]
FLPDGQYDFSDQHLHIYGDTDGTKFKGEREKLDNRGQLQTKYCKYCAVIIRNENYISRQAKGSKQY